MKETHYGAPKVAREREKRPVLPEGRDRRDAMRDRGKNSVARNKSGIRWWPVVVAVLFFAGLWGAVQADRLPGFVPGIYAAVSVLAAGLYWKDKRAASQDAWRVSEATLLTVSLLGGWPGALCASQFLRHKTKKIRFRVMFWLVVVLNMAGLALSLSGEGAGVIQRIVTTVGRG